MWDKGCSCSVCVLNQWFPTLVGRNFLEGWLKHWWLGPILTITDSVGLLCGQESLHFSQVLRWCWCCWSKDHTSRTTALYVILFFLCNLCSSDPRGHKDSKSKKKSEKTLPDPSGLWKERKHQFLRTGPRVSMSSMSVLEPQPHSRRPRTKSASSYDLNRRVNWLVVMGPL